MTFGRSVVTAVVAIATLATAGVAQQAQPKPALVMTAHNLTAAGARHAARGSRPDVLLAGDVIRYGLVFTNVTAAPIARVEFKDVIPVHLRYVAGSARANRDDVTIQFSIDGGATYSAQPMVEEIVDGRRVSKPAPPERYTHIWWQVAGSIEPGDRLMAEFRARLPEPAHR
jgi:uncharacterized repeat protein (TIGR01451 family)